MASTMTQRIQSALDFSGSGFSLVVQDGAPPVNRRPSSGWVVHGNVRIPFSVHDGSINVMPGREVVSISVPKRRQRFNVSALKNLVRSMEVMAQMEVAHKARIKPFVDAIGVFASAAARSKGRVKVGLGHDVASDGRMSFVMSGAFTLDEVREIIAGLDRSRALYPEVVQQVHDS